MGEAGPALAAAVVGVGEHASRGGDGLAVAAEDRTGYDREQSFGGGIDADRDGCNTRMEVLLEEAVEPPAVTGRCTLSGGRWYSWYDGTVIDGPRGIDIDHLVPLADAQDSGASSALAWRRTETTAFSASRSPLRYAAGRWSGQVRPRCRGETPR